MKISEQWLREWVNPDVSTEQLAEQLTMAGLEVDSIESAAPAFTHVVIAEVLEVVQHPDADKLRVCKVNTGEAEPLQIVCGASNVRPGLRVPAAVIGAVLPGDFKIKKSKLRGVESFGMLCSAVEIGLAESSEGLWELAEDAPVGTSIRDYLGLDDQVIEVDLTPNRGDCLSIAGIAREVGVLNRCTVRVPEIKPVSASITDLFPVSIQAEEDCPVYIGRVIRGVNPAAETPLWMKERLRRSGLRSLGPLVDVTNYVLLERGQPMHAFDLDSLKQGIVVRKAEQGEKLELLDGKTIELNSDTLVIADSNGPVALAGIMGGQATAVSDTTSDIFLECAYFSPMAIAGKARSYGLQTDSSYRFERGVNPQMQLEVMELATRLILEITGGQAGPVIESTSMAHAYQPRAITLRQARLARMLGMTIPDAEVRDILDRLGMQSREVAEGWEVTPPAFRFDISIEADLVEEVGRVYGYNHLPTSSYSGNLNMLPVKEVHNLLGSMHQVMQQRGFQEVITYSFVDPNLQQLLEPEAQAIALANPISSDMSVMRTSLWTGLISTMLYNLNRQQDRVHIFESGLKYIMQDNELKQIKVISAAICGQRYPEQWSEKGQVVDFYDLKGDLEAILHLTGRKDQFIFKTSGHSSLHPGQSASIELDNKCVGWIGQIHPEILQKLGVSNKIFVFEVEIEAIAEVAVPRFEPLSRFPSIRRDIAVVVDEDISSQQVIDCVAGVLPGRLKEILIFDVYKGKGVDFGRKSLALGLILQESSRTLTDQEVDSAVDKIVGKLQEQLAATLRE